MREVHIHHLRLLLTISQLASMMLFPVWMYTDVWQIITLLHRVRTIVCCAGLEVVCHRGLELQCAGRVRISGVQG